MVNKDSGKISYTSILLTTKKFVRNKSVAQELSVMADTKKTIDFHYIKGVDFRSVHVDGAIGGLTNKGFLHIALFAERSPIPQKTSHKILPDGSLGDEILESRESKTGIVRQMEVDLIMNEETTRDLRIWLDQQLEEFDSRRKQMEQLKKGADASNKTHKLN